MLLVSAIYRMLRIHNDIRAIRKGRIGKRIVNKGICRLAGRLMR